MSVWVGVVGLLTFILLWTTGKNLWKVRVQLKRLSGPPDHHRGIHKRNIRGYGPLLLSLYWISSLSPSPTSHSLDFFVYYQSIKRNLNRRTILECRCDERLKTKSEGSSIHWVVRGTVTPKDIDEVNKREVYECDGWVCDLDVTGESSIFNVIHRAPTLGSILSTFDLICEENVTRLKWKPLVECYLNSWSWKETVSFPSFLGSKYED